MIQPEEATAFKCYSCGTSVNENETEIMGANLIYKKVYMCSKCKRKRKIVVFSLIALLIAAFTWLILDSIKG